MSPGLFVLAQATHTLKAPPCPAAVLLWVLMKDEGDRSLFKTYEEFKEGDSRA